VSVPGIPNATIARLAVPVRAVLAAVLALLVDVSLVPKIPSR
jgi:hypothetical protein